MKLDAKLLFAPLVAAVLMFAVFNITLGAVRTSDIWLRTEPTKAPAANPYVRIDGLLAYRPGGDSGDTRRDPFNFGSTTTPVSTRSSTPRPAPPPPPPPQPILTSIVWDNDPRATVRWGGRDYSVRPNTLFADFRVVSITRDQVQLDRGGESLVLRLVSKGGERVP